MLREPAPAPSMAITKRHNRLLPRGLGTGLSRVVGGSLRSPVSPSAHLPVRAS